MRNKGNKKDKNKSLVDYECFIGSSEKASDFEVTAKSIINHIQETIDSGKDVAETMRMMNGPNKTRGVDKHKSKNKKIEINKLSFAQLK